MQVKLAKPNKAKIFTSYCWYCARKNPDYTIHLICPRGGIEGFVKRFDKSRRRNRSLARKMFLKWITEEFNIPCCLTCRVLDQYSNDPYLLWVGHMPRIDYIFSNFERIYFRVIGRLGKDWKKFFS